MTDAPKSYIYIGKHTCDSFLLLSGKICQTCIQGFCAFPSFLLSCRIYSLCWCLLRVLCSLAFERILTDSSYEVASEQDSIQIIMDLCGGFCSLLPSCKFRLSLALTPHPGCLSPSYKCWGSYPSSLGFHVYRALLTVMGPDGSCSCVAVLRFFLKLIPTHFPF